MLVFFKHYFTELIVVYLEEVTGGDKEGRVLLLVFRTLLSQRRQSLQAQLTDLRAHPEDAH